MRVLSLLPFSPPSTQVGGAERQMHALHRGLRARGVDVRVLADAEVVGPGRREHDGVPIWGVPFPVLTSSPWRPGNARAWMRMRALVRLVREEIGPVDLVQATPFRQPALWADTLGRALGVPWVARVACTGSQGDFTFLEGNWLTRRRLPGLASRAAAVVVLEEATAAAARAAGVPGDRIVRIPNAMVLDRVPAPDEAARPPRDGVVLFVGRVAGSKRVDVLVRAWARCAAADPAFPPLEIVGGGELDPLRGIAAEAGVAERVRMHGVQPGPEPFLARAACFVNPSESEGFPNAVLEACACGVPPLLSDIPVHREIAEAAGTADFLFPVGDAAALADALARFHALPLEEKAALRRRSALYAAAFTPESRDEAYLSLYRRVLGRER